MEILIILIPLALLLGGFFISSFIWSARKGQYDDLETPRFRMLLEENKKIKPLPNKLKDDL
jgi:cbb3-type cytochrome oxidase maturation protein